MRTETRCLHCPMVMNVTCNQTEKKYCRITCWKRHNNICIRVGCWFHFAHGYRICEEHLNKVLKLSW